MVRKKRVDAENANASVGAANTNNTVHTSTKGDNNSNNNMKKINNTAVNGSNINNKSMNNNSASNGTGKAAENGTNSNANVSVNNSISSNDKEENRNVINSSISEEEVNMINEKVNILKETLEKGGLQLNQKKNIKRKIKKLLDRLYKKDGEEDDDDDNADGDNTNDGVPVKNGKKADNKGLKSPASNGVNHNLNKNENINEPGGIVNMAKYDEREKERKEIEKKLNEKYNKLESLNNLKNASEIIQKHAEQRIVLENLIEEIHGSIQSETEKTPKPISRRTNSQMLMNQINEYTEKKKKDTTNAVNAANNAAKKNKDSSVNTVHTVYASTSSTFTSFSTIDGEGAGTGKKAGGGKKGSSNANNSSVTNHINENGCNVGGGTGNEYLIHLREQLRITVCFENLKKFVNRLNELKAKCEEKMKENMRAVAQKRENEKRAKTVGKVRDIMLRNMDKNDNSYKTNYGENLVKLSENDIIDSVIDIATLPSVVHGSVTHALSLLFQPCNFTRKFESFFHVLIVRVNNNNDNAAGGGGGNSGRNNFSVSTVLCVTGLPENVNKCVQFIKSIEFSPEFTQIECDAKMRRLIIGVGGSNVRLLEKEYNVFINCLANNAYFLGSRENVIKLNKHLKEDTLYNTSSGGRGGGGNSTNKEGGGAETEGEKEKTLSVEMPVRKNIAKYIYEFKSDLCNELEQEFGTKVIVIRVNKYKTNKKENETKNNAGKEGGDGENNEEGLIIIKGKALNKINDAQKKMQCFLDSLHVAHVPVNNLIKKLSFMQPYTQLKREKDISIVKVGELIEIIGEKEKCLSAEKKLLEMIASIPPPVLSLKLAIPKDNFFIFLSDKTMNKIKEQFNLQSINVKQGKEAIWVEIAGGEEEKKNAEKYIIELNERIYTDCIQNVNLALETVLLTNGKEKVKTIEEEEDVCVNINKNRHKIVINGLDAKSVQNAKNKIDEINEEVSKTYTTERVHVQKDKVGMVIGKAGSVMSKIKSENNLLCIDIDDRTSEVILVADSAENVEKAKAFILEITAEKEGRGGRGEGGRGEGGRAGGRGGGNDNKDNNNNKQTNKKASPSYATSHMNGKNLSVDDVNDEAAFPPLSGGGAVSSSSGGGWGKNMKNGNSPKGRSNGGNITNGESVKREEQEAQVSVNGCVHDTDAKCKEEEKNVVEKECNNNAVEGGGEEPEGVAAGEVKEE